MLANNQGSACKHRRHQYSAQYFKEFDTVQRPFISKSFKELEEIFRKALRDKDQEFLRLLDHELTFRQKNQKTPALRKEVAQSLAKAPASQADLFAGAAPSPAKSRSAARAAAQHSRPATRRKPKFKPTDEQDAALQAFLKGNSLKINAFAGSGKTSTLQLLANATGLRGCQSAPKIHPLSASNFDPLVV
ncbi:hypothetical protein [Rhizobium laguerreae]|uniref:hypothetical protein n=1 Tax=Rhizobium laguerreae TaxID=1076926 RepID=UPI001C91A1EF|nr:hypothetical protein [Rhizobium laguerreae]MBY3320861.1 hypothetical protein [Rhizobium laguerreae]MBY3361983.1 hypothetical protein [Rhizobium laguerreae]